MKFYILYTRFTSVSSICCSLLSGNVLCFLQFNDPKRKRKKKKRTQRHEVHKIQRRRPSGTDGSDFSYRMVVDSRYTKVAKGKSRLSVLIFAQAVIQFIGFIFTFLLTSEGGPIPLSILSAAVGLVSLIMGELGRKRSRVSLLRVCMVTSTIAMLISVFCVAKINSVLEVINNPANWEAKKFEFLEAARVLLGIMLTVIVGITSVLVLVS